MKKQILFYVLWDVLFLVFLYVISNAESWRQQVLHRAEHPFAFLAIMIILYMVAGAFIGWLVFTTSKYERTKKSAVLEFALVGGFGLYLSSIFFLYFTPALAVIGWPQLFPMWMFGVTTINLGGILFGYELCIFIIRMVQCHKQKKLADTEQEKAETLHGHL